MWLHHSIFPKQLSKNYFLIIGLVILEETYRLHKITQQAILKASACLRYYFESIKIIGYLNMKKLIFGCQLLEFGTSFFELNDRSSLLIIIIK
jgi:hypothetical protein